MRGDNTLGITVALLLVGTSLLTIGAIKNSQILVGMSAPPFIAGVISASIKLTDGGVFGYVTYILVVMSCAGIAMAWMGIQHKSDQFITLGMLATTLSVSYPIRVSSRKIGMVAMNSSILLATLYLLWAGHILVGGILGVWTLIYIGTDIKHIVTRQDQQSA